MIKSIAPTDAGVLSGIVQGGARRLLRAALTDQ
jgi:hypothetical protein